MVKIGIVLGSVREGRNGKAVADWTLQKAQALNKDSETEYEIVDLLDYDLPFLGKTPTESQQKAIGDWSAKIDSFDGYIFITAEYNHGVAGAFKNSLDFLKPEFKNKAVAFVGYGGLGAARSIESLRLITAEQGLASVQRNVNFSLITDFENMSVFTPAAFHDGELSELLDQLLAWSKALKTIR